MIKKRKIKKLIKNNRKKKSFNQQNRILENPRNKKNPNHQLNNQPQLRFPQPTVNKFYLNLLKTSLKLFKLLNHLKTQFNKLFKSQAFLNKQKLSFKVLYDIECLLLL
jgi:hypothetical protein